MTLEAGTKLGRYEIRSMIGKGGMGEVYLAQDTELDRVVAIKILPADVAADQQRLQRFIQEAKSASALNHPHIITIFEIGNVGDSKFIATEYIDGETLRQKMNRGLRLGDVLEISSQIAGALAAAHAAGIVHRDIKPENVMVRKDGYVKILDFGLAKLSEPKDSRADTEAPTRAIVNTGAGTVMGTATYMSPEQAKGVRVDERTDLWSLGALMYEMTTGHVPFKGETPTETISLILLKDPPPMARYADDIPEELDRIVEKALTKDLDERYQSAKDLVIDLKHLKRKIEVGAEIDRTVPPEIRAAVSTHSHPGASTVSGTNVTHLSTSGERRASSAEYVVSEIKRHRTGAFVAAGAAVLAVAALAFFYFPRHAPALTEKDTILLADFVNTTGEQVFDGTLKQALSVQLGQSPYLNIFPDDRVNESLRFMGRQPGERITRDVAKEICQRNGIKAMILGSIAGLGSHYVLTLEAVNSSDGDSIAKEQVEADSKEQVLTALGKATSQLREKLGESLTSLKKFDAPVEQATTSSLDALKAFTQGTEKRFAGHDEDAVAFFKKAVELDPNFAMAYARLAVLYSNRFQIDLGAQFAQKAYDLRDRVSKRERYYIEEKYASYVTGDRDEAIKVLKAWTQDYPNDYIPHNNLSVNYSLLGNFEDSLSEANESARLSPFNSTAYGNIVDTYLRMGRLDEAQQTLDQTLGDNKERGIYRFNSWMIAYMRGDQAKMQADLDWFANRPTESDYAEAESNIAAVEGRWRSSLDFANKVMDIYRKEDRTENIAQWQATNGMFESQFGMCDQAKQWVAQSLATFRGRSNIGQAAFTLAACNDPRASQMIDDIVKNYPKDTPINLFAAPMTHAFIELNRGNTQGALDALQPTVAIERGTLCGFWCNYVRGSIFLKGKMGPEAAAEFKKIIDHRALDPLSPAYPLAHLGLARASVLTADTSTARTEYQNFFAAWKNADQDLPILIEAKKEYDALK
jgi:serine/threonine protein kinase/tetratricopeptide (TPR) repeat protein